MLVVFDPNNNPRAGKFPNDQKEILLGYTRTHNLELLEVPDDMRIHDGKLINHQFILAYINEVTTNKLISVKTGVPIIEKVIDEPKEIKDKPKGELFPGDVINFIYHGQGRSNDESKRRDGPWLVTAIIYTFIGLKKINADFTIPEDSDTLISTKATLMGDQAIVNRLTPVWS